jgi:hypothetical protein
MRISTYLTLAALLLPATTAAQTARWSTYGQGCAQSITPDTILNQRLDSVSKKLVVNLPQIGTEFGVMILRNSTQSIYDHRSLLFVGISNTRWQNQKLPLNVPLDIYGNRWGPCVLTSIEAALPGRRFCFGSGCWEYSFRIPNNTTLIGASVYMQWAVLYDQPGKSGPLIRYSNGGHALVGR